MILTVRLLRSTPPNERSYSHLSSFSCWYHSHARRSLHAHRCSAKRGSLRSSQERTGVLRVRRLQPLELGPHLLQLGAGELPACRPLCEEGLPLLQGDLDTPGERANLSTPALRGRL